MFLTLMETGGVHLPAPAWVFGIIAFALLMIGGLVVASFGGARLALVMPPLLSTILFGIFVSVTAVQLALRAIRQQRAAKDGDAT